MHEFIFTTEDISDNFDRATLSRGQTYYNKGAVIHCGVESNTNATLYIDATVMGGKKYSQDMIMSKNSFGEIIIDGECSCPVGYHCKHMVAVSYYLLNTDLFESSYKPKIPYIEPKKRTTSAEDKWLEEFVSLKQKEEVIFPVKREYFLIYRLFLDIRVHNHINFYKAKMLKTGGISKGQKLSSDKYLYSYTYNYDCISEKDKELASLLNNISKGYSNDIAFEGEYGSVLFKKLIETNHCYYKEASTPLRFINENKKLTFNWKKSKEYTQLKSNINKNEYFLGKLIPALCINFEENTVYKIESDYDEKSLTLMLNAPKIHITNVPKFVKNLLTKLPELEFPLPKEFKVEELNIEPIPYLFLYGMNNPETGKVIHAMELSFEYNGNFFDSSSKSSINNIYKNDKTIKIIRDIKKEEQCREIIESKGFIYELAYDIKAYLSKVQNGNIQETIERWRAFREVIIPKLKEEGWEIEIDETFKYKFEYIENIEVENEESEGNNWFELSFSVNIGGRKQPLLPIVTPLLEEFDSVESLPKHLNLELEDGGFLHLSSKEIKPILQTIFELFDKKKGNSLFVHPYDAHLLNLDSNIEWKGSQELKELSQKLKDFKGISEVKPSKNLQATLRDYQQFGLNWLSFLHEFKFSGILADDMGLGKTVQTLAFLQLLKEQGKLSKSALIIMPTSLIGNWKNEIKKFTPNLTFLELYGVDRGDKFNEIKNHDIILTTYSLAQRDADRYLREQFYYVILDEAQKIKNPTTKLAIAIKKIRAEHRLALSGTPIENHLGELWSIFDFLMSGFLDNLKIFRELFQKPIEKDYDMKRRTLLNKKIAPFILRRTKDEVVKELPPKTEIIKRATFGSKQAKLYENIRLTMEKKVREAIKGKGLSRSHITILDALLKLRQVCCDPSLLKLDSAKKVKDSAKLEMFLELIDTLCAENKKVLVFSQFTSMLDILEKEIKQRQITYTKLTGSTRKREEVIDKFTKGDASIFLISLKAGGIGLNLVEADTVIHYDPWWNPAVENQATDRAYRIGQDKPVFVYKLIVENSIEEKIIELQERKKSLQAGIYNGNEDKEEKFDGNELVELLRL